VNWQPLNLAAADYDVLPERPVIGGLLYAGKRHGVSGPPESIKTVFAWILAREHVRAGNAVAVVDFEMGPHATRRLLLDLGFTLEELRDQVLYFESPEEPGSADINEIVEANVTLVVIDAAAGAYDASGLDDNKRQDVEKFARAWVRPLFEVGITTVLIDHVTKNVETRGKYMIGSERKLGGLDVHLGLELVGQPLTRGGSAVIKVRVHKDRGAHLTRPVAAELELQSKAETHRITWAWKAPASSVSSGEDWRPTIYMERVSRHLERHGPMSRTTVYKAGLGKRELLVQAVGCLLDVGNLTEDGSLLVPTVPFRREEAGSLVPKRFPTVPGTGKPTGSPSSPAYKAGTGNGEPLEDELDRLQAEADRLEAKYAEVCRRCGGSYVRGTGNSGELCPGCARGAA
jgi:hypothetical protein